MPPCFPASKFKEALLRKGKRCDSAASGPVGHSHRVWIFMLEDHIDLFDFDHVDPKTSYFVLFLFRSSRSNKHINSHGFEHADRKSSESTCCLYRSSCSRPQTFTWFLNIMSGTPPNLNLKNKTRF